MDSNTVSSVAPATYTHYEALTPLGCRHFYGTLNGQAGPPATRCGSKRSGLEAIAASWNGAVSAYVYQDDDSGQDMVQIQFRQWQGSGRSLVLYQGPINPNDADLLRCWTAVARQAVGEPA